MTQQQIDILCLILLTVALPIVHVLESKFRSRKKLRKEASDESVNDKFAGRGR